MAVAPSKIKDVRDIAAIEHQVRKTVERQNDMFYFYGITTFVVSDERGS
jgi:hypothetical protein